MNNIIIIATLFLTLIFNSVAFTTEDIHDNLLKAYRISPDQEAQCTRDGKTSPFWVLWDSANNGGTFAMDFVDMTPDQRVWVDGSNSFSDSTDARMIIKAAYGITGLYLYFQITDNAWIPPTSCSDAVDVFLDSKSSQTIRDANPDSQYVGPSYFASFTKSTIEYFQYVGSRNATLPSMLNFNYYIPRALSFKNVEISQLSRDYPGWDLDMDSMTSHIRRVEWKIPWKWVGSDSAFIGIPSIGTLIAFSTRYMDLDSPIQTGQKNLTWKERIPLSDCMNINPPHQFCDAWGDIEITGQSVGVNGRSISFSRKQPSINNSIQLKISQTNKISPYIVSEKQGTTTRWSLTGRKWHIRK